MRELSDSTKTMPNTRKLSVLGACRAYGLPNLTSCPLAISASRGLDHLGSPDGTYAVAVLRFPPRPYYAARDSGPPERALLTCSIAFKMSSALANPKL